jgi:CPA2 family monovalent cation:H+ antiporter-2
VFGLGSAQVLTTADVIASVAYAFGNGMAGSIVLGACLALSSTAIVMQMLTESGRIGTPVGQTAFSVLLFQDLAVIPILFVVGALSGGGSSVVLGLAMAVASATVAIGGIVLIGRKIVRPFLAFANRTGSREFFLAAVLLTVIGTAALTERVGLSHALGAFLAGLLLAETEFRHRVAADLEPFKGLLVGVFFVSVGLGIDVAAVLANPVWLFLATMGLIAFKAAILFALALAFRVRRAIAAETALLLGQGGEFGFIVINLATGPNLLVPETAQFMLLVVGLSMALTPWIATLAQRLARRLEGAEAGPADDLPPSGDFDNHVVIVGYGRVGRAVGKLLDRQCIPHIGIDVSSDRVAELRRTGVTIFQGDAAQHAILEHLGAERALALVVTMDDAEAAHRVVAAAREQWSDLRIFARVHDDAHAQILSAAGATHVTPETTEASLQLGEAVLTATGVPEDVARELVADAREEARWAGSSAMGARER